MTLNAAPIYQTFSGDGTTVNFTIPFVFFSDSNIVVTKIAADGTETLQVIGITHDYTLTGSGVGHPLSTTVVMNVAPASGTKLRVERQLPLDQPYNPNNLGSIDAVAMQLQFDRAEAQIQQIDEAASRAVKIAKGVSAAVSVQLPAPAANQFLQWNAAGTALQNSAGGGVLALPTDGAYGGVNGPIAGIAAGDKNEDAFDKVETVLGKLAPIKPPLLSAKTLSPVGSFSALESGTGTLRGNVVTSTTPTLSWGGVTVAADGAYDPETGTLTAEIDSTNSGTITLTPSDDSGTNGQLQIQANGDFYLGVAGKAGFWSAFVARIVATTLAVGVHTARLKLSAGAGVNTPLLTFYVDDSGTPSISAGNITSAAGTTTISGVPALRSGDSVTAVFTVTNAIKTYYNATRIASVSAGYVNAANAALPGSPPSNGASFAASIPTTIANSQYVETLTIGANAFSANNTSATATIQRASGIMRVDSLSSESTRLSSGTGQYPSTGFGNAWVSTDLLSANKELQMLAGFYQYPPLVNYTTNYPVAGPDYSALTADSYASMRWATFSLGTVSSASSVSFTINSATNFGGATLVTGIALYVKVGGATGWLDANAAYPGVGSPSADGDGALDVASSTTTAKRVTFGATVRSGTVYVRIGIPSGSTKKFGSIS